jgi:hypothetical protein
MQDSKQDSGKPGQGLTLYGRTIPKWTLWLTGILGFYTLLGFFLVPWVAERQLTRLSAERLDLELSIERLYFNPFTMLLEVEDLRALDTDQAPLVELSLLRTNFSPLRLALLKLHFAEFRIADLDLYFTRSTAADNTATMLAQRWQASAAPQAEPQQPEPAASNESGNIIPLEVDATRLDNLNLHFRDEVPDEPFDTVLTLAEAQIDGLSSIEERSASKSVLLRFENDATLEWSGGLQLNPLELRGQVTLNNFTLDLVDDYVRQNLPFSLSDGRVNFSTDYDLDFPENAIRLNLNGIGVELSNLAVTQAGREEPFLTAGLVRLNNGQLGYPDNTASLESIGISQLGVQVTRDTSGELNVQQMLDAMAGDGTSTEPSTSPGPSADDTTDGWSLTLDQFDLSDSQLSFTDNAIAEASSLSTSVALQITGINNQPGTTIPLSLQLSPASGGDLAINGDSSFLPEPRLQADARISALDLTALQPYLSEFTFLNLDSGALAADLALTVNPEEVFRLQGGVELLEFATSDQQLEETILAWNRIAVDGIDLEMANSTLEVSELILDQLFARVVINEDSSTNIGRSIKTVAEEAEPDIVSPDEAAEQPATASTAALPLDIILGRITVNDGRSDFTDRDLPIVFNANIRELNGSADGFSTQSTEPLSLDLEGNVDEFGQLQLSSALNPFDIAAQSQVRLQFRNLDLPSVSPYTIKFAGREIAEGNVDIALEYDVNSGILDANNQVVLRNLRLGERVEQPGAMNLPLDLATALLKDSNDVIDLEIPVSGDINDPQFDLGPAIRTAIGNVLGNIVSAPFRLLGSLVGGGDRVLDRIQFEPGSSAIAPPERQILEQLVSALSQRPELVLEVSPMQGQGDRTALQQQAVRDRINTLLEQTTEDTGSLTDRRRAIDERLYQEAALTPTLEELQQANMLMTEQTEADEPVDLAAALTFSNELDVPAYVQEIRSRLSEAEPVSPQDLNALAESRARAVSDYLAEQGLDVATRTVTDKPQISELSDDGRLTMEFGLTAQRRAGNNTND